VTFESEMAPLTSKRYTVQGFTGFDGLRFDDQAPIPKLGERDILVKLHAASLNYRDLVIARVCSSPSISSNSLTNVQGEYPFPLRDGVVPTSDGAGEVEAIGSGVSRFKKGDKVVTLFNQGHQFGSLTPKTLHTATGGVRDGALTQYGVFDETALVEMPEGLSWEEASTLPCAALTAWNALYGLGGRIIKAGDFVLTEGTGKIDRSRLVRIVDRGS
jgi:NADPH:quinone reductase-like Zn-dependent oxidoreductase